MNKPQLFLLHFAGGSIYSFQFIKPFLATFDFIPLELPGRGRRAKEPLIRDLRSAIQDLYEQVLSRLRPGPFFIYGHSMGATLALYVAHELEKSGKASGGIIVSGNAGPGTRDNKQRYLMQKEDFKAELKRIGGMPDEVLQNEELLEYFEPMLKADFEIVENGSYPDIQPLQASIFAMMGIAEEKSGMIANWKKFTVSSFESLLMDGDHFFIHKHPEKIADMINHCYASYLARSRRTIAH